jgi:hypothetical protein
MELLMQTEIFSVAGLGKLRVTDGWKDAALYCNPDDPSPFLWNVYASAHWIRLSPPAAPYYGTNYASIRSDNDFYIQMRTPGVLNYDGLLISDPQSVEPLFFKQLQFFTAQLISRGNYLGVNDQLESGPYKIGNMLVGTCQGYRVRCVKSDPDKFCFWYFKNPTATRSLAAAAATQTPSAIDIQTTLKGCSVDVTLDELAPLLSQIA